MSTYKIPLQETVDKFLATGQAFEPHDIVEQFKMEHGDLANNHFEEWRDRQLLRDVKEMLRTRSEDDDDNDQMTLPGLRLPTAIAIPAETESGFVYRSTSSATWDDLQGARVVRIRNVERAQVRLDQLEASIEMLRPEMEHDRTITVADAVDRIRGASDAA